MSTGTLAALLTLGFLLFQPGSAVSGPPQDAELRELQRAFKATRDPLDAVDRRLRALDGVRGDLRPATARALLDAYERVEDELLPLAERHLDAVRRDQAANGSEHRGELDAQRGLQDAILGAVARVARGDEEGADAGARRQLVEEALERSRAPLTLRLAAARAAAGVELDAKLAKALRRALGSRRDDASVLVALAALEAAGPASAVLAEETAEALEHHRAPVRYAAARALAGGGALDAVEPLLAALERAEAPRGRARLAAALAELTGMRIGGSPAAWRRWWEREGREQSTEAADGGPASRPGPEPGAPDESARYHGIALDGRSVVFVIDRSRSMNKRVSRTRAAAREQRAAGERAERRFDRAKAELIAALRALGPDVHFGLVAFGGTVSAFEDRPVPAEPKQLERAVEWIEALELELGTNVYGALETAFHLAGRGAADADFEARYDTLCLLSDGVPFVAGRRDSTDSILSAARRWNAAGQLVLHTVGLGDEVPADFMGALAREHGGRFVLETGTGSVDLSQRPNLVLFLVDDMGWGDVGFAGEALIETPALDRLAAEGMRFEQAYCNAPNCAPSRACLLTGLYAPRHGIYTVLNSDRGRSEDRALVPIETETELGDDFTTLAEVLADHGYATASIGKWHLGPDPTAHGFGHSVAGNRAGHPKSYFSPYKNPSLEDGPEREYLTDRLTDEALAFVRANAERPFFLYLSHYAPHRPLQAREGVIEKYLERGASERRAVYAAMVESLDRSMGRLLALLEELDLDERTVVCFTSDNGGLLGQSPMEPLRGQKGHLEEAGIRVPLAVRWPGRVAAGASVRVPVVGSDLFPTFAQLAGAPAPEVDGESLVPLLLGDGTLDRQALFWHFPAYLEPLGRTAEFRARPCGAVRRGRYKLIEFFEDGRLELYDLRDDPGEARDLSAEREDLRDELHALMRDWREEVGAPVPTERNPDYAR